MSTPDYSACDQRGWCGDPSRGAAMGRAESRGSPDYAGTILVRSVYVDSQGYDRNGTYFGSVGRGEILVWFASTDDEQSIDGMMRSKAKDGDAAMRAALATIASDYPKATVQLYSVVSDDDREDCYLAYVDAALWSTMVGSEDGRDDTCLDAEHSETDLDDRTRELLRRHVATFCAAMGDTVIAAIAARPGLDWSQVGHDLWLTANGHGCGFWDGDWPEKEGEILTAAAKRIGETNLGTCDDGKVGI